MIAHEVFDGINRSQMYDSHLIFDFFMYIAAFIDGSRLRNKLMLPSLPASNLLRAK